jgi:hypothetical protein
MERIEAMDTTTKLTDNESSGECACGNIGNIHKRMERQLLTLRERERDGRVVGTYRWHAAHTGCARKPEAGRCGSEVMNAPVLLGVEAWDALCRAGVGVGLMGSKDGDKEPGGRGGQ